MIRTFTFSLVTFFVSAVACSDGRAETLDDSVGKVSKKLIAYLQSKNETSITVGSFNGPPQLAAMSGPAIAECFRKQFERESIKVTQSAKIGLRGEFAPTKPGKSGIGVLIKGSLVDSFGEVLTDFSVDVAESSDAKSGATKDAPGQFSTVVNKTEDVVQLLGATTSLNPDDLPSDRDSDLRDQLLNPSLIVEGTRCRAAKDSPYEVEILCDNQPLAVKVEEGRGFVGIDRDRSYVVRCYNNSPHDAAVRLSIDGLSVFHFSEMKKPDGSPRYSVYIIPPKGSVILKGWHKNNNVVNSFLVTKYADSAAGSINHKENVGMLTAVFSACWNKGTPSLDGAFTEKSESNATGFGPPIQEVTHEVEREIGKVRASVSLRYTK